MNLKHWLDHLLPPAVTRSWALAAGCPDEALAQPGRPKHGAVEERTELCTGPGTKPQDREATPFDDVQ